MGFDVLTSFPAMVPQTPLRLYRLFPVCPTGHVVGAPQIIEAMDDAEAVREAERLAAGRATEVWSGTRLVSALNGAGAPTPSVDRTGLAVL